MGQLAHVVHHVEFEGVSIVEYFWTVFALVGIGRYIVEDLFGGGFCDVLVVVPDMHDSCRTGKEFAGTVRTGESLLFLLVAGIVRSVEVYHVSIVVLLADEPFVALLIGAVIRLLSGVVGHVLTEGLLASKELGANRALEANRNVRVFQGKVNSHRLHRGELPLALGTREVALATLPNGGQLFWRFNVVNDLLVPDSILIPHEESLAMVALVPF